ncbi:MAG: hydroxyisourate hydrolase [Alphaproteobacteria bacterium]
MGRLTTHVLDTSLGRPAGGIKIELFRVGDDKPLALASTNQDGRCPNPLLEGATLTKGTYVLHFHAGAYFDRTGQKQPAPKFLDMVVIRFGISQPDQHYHVPLLLSPFGYSTYRGS